MASPRWRSHALSGGHVYPATAQDFVLAYTSTRIILTSDASLLTLFGCEGAKMASPRQLRLRFDWRRTTIAASAVFCPPFRMLLIAILAACACRWAMAETSTPPDPRIVHDSWTFKDGAPESVEALAQTTDGHLWLGTPSGLFRFDGARFELFRSPFGDQLPSTNVSALFAPGTGGLWVGFRFGGFNFVKNGKVTNFELPAPTGTVSAFAQDRYGIVWAATTGGVWRFDGSSWQQNPDGWNPQLRAVSQVGFDREGILWALTEARGEVGKQLFYLPPGGAQFRKAADHLVIQGFTRDADLNVLTSHESGPGEPGSGIQLEGSLPAYPILRKGSEQIVDRANGIWILPREGPVMRHPAGGPLAEILSKAPSRDSETYDVDPFRYARLVDREGGVWLGDQGGVHRFSYSPLIEQVLPKPPGPLFALVPDEGGAVWIGAGNGDGLSTLYHVANGKIDDQRSQKGAALVAYRAPDKTFWFGGEGGLWHLVHGSLTKINLPKEMAELAAFLTTITQDESGGMWVSFGPLGLYRFKGGVWTKYGGRRDLPTSGVLIEFTDTLGRIWFGSTKSRMAVLDGDRVQAFGPRDGVQVGNISAIYGRGSEIWIGGEFGVQQFDHGRFHTIHAVDRESLRGISGIIETANGDLWLNGLGGIIHLRQAEVMQALKNPAYQVSGERFGRREGLPGLPSQLERMPTALEGTDGRLWFTVRNGVVWLDPARAANRIPSPPVTIQSISGDDKSYALGRPLKFPARTSSVQIAYAAVCLSDPEAIHFRYKLRETDQDWHEVGTSTSVSYRNLPPGSYHFLVNASDTNGMWSDNTATVEFMVLPAFYQTIWFRVLCGVFFLALLWAGYRYRVRQLQREFALTLEARVGERTSIARDLHDTLLQSSHGLLLRFQTVSELLPERPEEAKEKLGRAIDQTANFITEARDEVQGLRASTVQTNDLARAVNALGEELTADPANHNAPALRVTVEGETRNLHPILRDEIYRIAAEALRNAFRHAQAQHLEVEILYDDRQFRLRVRDDGKGMDAAFLAGQEPTGHFGLNGMRERAKLIGGNLTVWSELDAGTEVELRVPAGIAYTTARKGSWLSRLLSGKTED
jgi:signal transduction histidine kinase/ligand-binding sensor domain-containing protein